MRADMVIHLYRSFVKVEYPVTYLIIQTNGALPQTPIPFLS